MVGTCRRLFKVKSKSIMVLNSILAEPIELIFRPWPLPIRTSSEPAYDYSCCKYELWEVIWWDAPELANHAYDSRLVGMWRSSWCAKNAEACIELVAWFFSIRLAEEHGSTTLNNRFLDKAFTSIIENSR